MLQPFAIGAKKQFVRKVSTADTATFESGEVHPVYATFALARDAEWCCRLFVLEMKEATEEGIGTFVHVNHHSPALVNSVVVLEATIKAIQKNEIICTYTAKVGERLIASGEQGQKIVKKERLEQVFASIQ
jgi:predicted thioesterase